MPTVEIRSIDMTANELWLCIMALREYTVDKSYMEFDHFFDIMKKLEYELAEMVPLGQGSDDKGMCCSCFRRFPKEQLHPWIDGIINDVCESCANILWKAN